MRGQELVMCLQYILHGFRAGLMKTGMNDHAARAMWLHRETARPEGLPRSAAR